MRDLRNENSQLKAQLLIQQSTQVHEETLRPETQLPQFRHPDDIQYAPLTDTEKAAAEESFRQLEIEGNKEVDEQHERSDEALRLHEKERLLARRKLAQELRKAKNDNDDEAIREELINIAILILVQDPIGYQLFAMPNWHRKNATLRELERHVQQRKDSPESTWANIRSRQRTLLQEFHEEVPEEDRASLLSDAREQHSKRLASTTWLSRWPDHLRVVLELANTYSEAECLPLSTPHHQKQKKRRRQRKQERRRQQGRHHQEHRHEYPSETTNRFLQRFLSGSLVLGPDTKETCWRSSSTRGGGE